MLMNQHLGMTDFTPEQGSQLFWAFVWPYILMGVAGLVFLFSIFMIVRYGQRPPLKTSRHNPTRAKALTTLYWSSIVAICLGVALVIANAPSYLGPIWLVGGTTLLGQVQFMLFKTTPVKLRPSLTGALRQLGKKQIPKLYHPTGSRIIMMVLVIALPVMALVGMALSYTHSVQDHYSTFLLNTNVPVYLNSQTSNSCLDQRRHLATDRFLCTAVVTGILSAAPNSDPEQFTTQLIGKITSNHYIEETDKEHFAPQGTRYFTHIQTQAQCILTIEPSTRSAYNVSVRYAFVCTTNMPWDVSRPGNTIFDAV